jgi:crotonobetainyl-CoA:carnitine CoA-transferase CaiB-like acyl-CoA transferase
MTDGVDQCRRLPCSLLVAVRARPRSRKSPHRNGGTVTIPAPPWHFSGLDHALTPQIPAPQGEHNEEILKELGYTDDQMRARTKSSVFN